MKLPADIDPECIAICTAMNALPGICTVESCCGHGERPHRVFFVVEEVSNLMPILKAAKSSAWHVEVDCAIKTSDMSDIAVFMLEGPIGSADIPGGANDFASWLPPKAE